MHVINKVNWEYNKYLNWNTLIAAKNNTSPMALEKAIHVCPDVVYEACKLENIKLSRKKIDKLTKKR